MKCAGCFQEIEIGDRYIEDTPSGFVGGDYSAADKLTAMVLGSSDNKVRFCEDCSEPGGDHMLKTHYEETDDDGTSYGGNRDTGGWAI
jgi:hypothetical protein